MSKFWKFAGAAGVLVLFASLARPQLGPPPAVDEQEISATRFFKPDDVVTIYLRGDASGTVFSDRLPATGNLISRSGKILSMDKSWVVIEGKAGKTVFPREAIAMIESIPEK